MSESANPTNCFAGNVRQAEPANEKTLRIKINSLKRTIKDLEFAKKEVDQEIQRLEKVRQSDPDRVPQQTKVIDEAKMMVPDSINRIMTSTKDLSNYLEEEGQSITNEELLSLARTTIFDGHAAVA